MGHIGLMLRLTHLHHHKSNMSHWSYPQRALRLIFLHFRNFLPHRYGVAVVVDDFR